MRGRSPSRSLFAALAILAACSVNAAQPAPSMHAPTLESGIPLDLARWRTRHYRDLAYRVDLVIEAGRDAVEGRLELDVTLSTPRDLVLDWRPAPGRQPVRDAEVNGRPVALEATNGHLVVPARATRRGQNHVALRFSAAASTAGGPLTRYVDPVDGAEYWYTLFVPADASSIFPCFDQPDLKARFSLSLQAPAEFRVVSNSRELSATDEGARRRHVFAATEPISPYLFAFAAGPFETLNETTSAKAPGAVQLYFRRSRRAQALAEGPSVLALNRRAIEWYADYFARPFPFAKYDLVLIPELAYGGMEHAGAAFLREESVLFPFQPASSDRLRRAQLVLHETAHQWFGDLVTMRWFDDLWLKEGFANFMAARASAALLGAALPDIDPWIAFNAVKTAAYRTDATRGTTPIRQPLANLDAAKSAYGNIVYSKAPGVLRQAEFFIGETAFRDAVRRFLATHAYGSAAWSDLVRAMEQASGRSLARWASTWVSRRGMPRVTLERETSETGIGAVRLEQEDVLREGGIWPMRTRLAVLADGRKHTLEVDLKGVKSRIAIKPPVHADLLFANDGDFGYGQFLLDDASRGWALEHAGEIDEGLLRALVLDSLWESVREAELDPASYLELAMRNLPREPDEITASALLARLRTAYLRYLTEPRRSALAARVESFVEAQMHSATTESRRIAYFRTFTDIAKSEPARSRLKNLLAGHERIEGVELRSRDRFRIIESLLASGDAEAPALLEAQAKADTSGEGRRYAFGVAAARPDQAWKRTLFERFLGDRALPESWIEEALGAFNELDHASLTAPLLEPALEALPALKRERRIFFVNDWLAAFIGGQSSRASLDVVNRFLRQQASLDADLRLKVLEALDVLERTVRIRTAFQ